MLLTSTNAAFIASKMSDGFADRAHAAYLGALRFLANDSFNVDVGADGKDRLGVVPSWPRDG